MAPRPPRAADRPWATQRDAAHLPGPQGSGLQAPRTHLFACEGVWPSLGTRTSGVSGVVSTQRCKQMPPTGTASQEPLGDGNRTDAREVRRSCPLAAEAQLVLRWGPSDRKMNAKYGTFSPAQSQMALLSAGPRWAPTGVRHGEHTPDF